MASRQECLDFINLIAPLVQKCAKEHGWKLVSPIMAQCICESGWGGSWISKAPYYNLFGMKKGGDWKGRIVNARTKECYDGSTYVDITDAFIAVDSFEEGIDQYFQFCERYSGRYGNLKECTNYEQYCVLVKQDGWATSPTYTNTLLSIIATWNLTQYDNLSIEVTVKDEEDNDVKVEVPIPSYFPIYRGPETPSIVNILNSLGYDSSYSYRSKIAKKNNIINYSGTADQNLRMVALAKAGLLLIP